MLPAYALHMIRSALDIAPTADVEQVSMACFSTIVLNMVMFLIQALRSEAQGKGQWIQGHVTFYGGSDASGTMGGACGYGNLYSDGYGTETAALSTTLFSGGDSCGACYAIQCQNSKYCNKKNPIIYVTATNFCPPDPSKPNNNGGWCNNPLRHFDLSQPAFEKIAFWRAGIVPVRYRRVVCKKTGGIRYKIKGNPHFNLVLITNISGGGAVKQVEIKGSRTKWMTMNRNWGANWELRFQLVGQAVSFRITSIDGEVMIDTDVFPSNWKFDQTYEGEQQFKRTTVNAKILN